MPFINSDNAGFLLKNPNRGLRGETYITLGENIRHIRVKTMTRLNEPKG